MARGVCSIGGCDFPHKALGLCRRHYLRNYRHGDPLAGAPSFTSLEARFWSKVDKSGECWPWQSTLDRYGYWQFGVSGRHVKAHRVSYELLVGPIPEGLVLDHLCRVPACVNPKHLEPVTQKENERRGWAVYVRKTHCPRGHEYTPENTYSYPHSRKRGCRECTRINQREQRAQRRKR